MTTNMLWVVIISCNLQHQCQSCSLSDPVEPRLHLISFSFIILLIYSYVRRGPIVSCGLLRQAENCCSSLFIQIYSLFLSQMVGVNQWARGDPPQPYYPNPPSATEHISQMKSFSPQSQSSITLFPPSDCCLSSFIRLLMVYKLRVMIPPLPSVLWDFLWPFWFCEASFCKWAAISSPSRAVCIAAERQEVKLCELCLMWWSHWE